MFPTETQKDNWNKQENLKLCNYHWSSDRNQDAKSPKLSNAEQKLLLRWVTDGHTRFADSMSNQHGSGKLCSKIPKGRDSNPARKRKNKIHAGNQATNDRISRGITLNLTNCLETAPRLKQGIKEYFCSSLLDQVILQIIL